MFIEGIGWFQITSVQEDDSGTSKAKSVTAQSHQYSLKDRGCKLLVSSEVGIVKNADGEIDENGTVKFDTTVFTVETATDFFKISTDQSGVVVVNRNDPYFNYDGKRYKIIESADKIVYYAQYHIN